MRFTSEKSHALSFLDYGISDFCFKHQALEMQELNQSRPHTVSCEKIKCRRKLGGIRVFQKK